MTDSPSFGARVLALGSAADRLELERVEARRAAFAESDAVVDALVLSALRGDRMVQAPTSKGERPVRLKLDSQCRRTIDAAFAAAGQQERGAWYLSAQLKMDAGTTQLPYWWRANRRFAMHLARKDGAAVADLSNTDALVLWAAVEPVMTELAAPLFARSGHRAATRVVDKRVTNWDSAVVTTYEAFGIGADAVQQFAPGVGWDELDADAVIARRDALLTGWAQADSEAVARLRALRIGRLVERYYSKAKGGQALRSRVMNDKAAQRVLSAYFGGDWLALLDYLGEQPHPDEQIAQELPTTRLIASDSSRIEGVAAEHGVPADEVQRMLAAYWNQPEASASPVELRVAALGRLWEELDALYAKQARGVPELVMVLATGHKRFSPELVDETRSLWGTTLLPSFPQRLVTRSNSVAAAGEAMGPALRFWRLVADCAWDLCESAHTHQGLDGLQDLEKYTRPAAQELARTGFPADPGLFAELRAAESKLGPIEAQEETVSEERYGFITTTMTVSGPGRRDGFEYLRDIITRHRRAWSDAYLSDYLQGLWQGELKAAGDTYHRHFAQHGKAPTVKRFAAMAAQAATDWFGGDLTGVYSALGLKSPIPAPTYERLLPNNTLKFYKQTYEALDRAARPPGTKENEATRMNALAGLARQGPRWVAIREASGESPTLAQFGSREFSQWDLLAEDREAAWAVYSDIVAAVVEQLTSTPATTPKPGRSDRPRRSDPHPATPPEALQDNGQVVPAARAAPPADRRAPGTTRGGTVAVSLAPVSANSETSEQPRRGLLSRLIGRR